MTTKLVGNVLTVVTDITKELYGNKVAAPMTAKDEDGNEIFRVTLSENGEGGIGKCGLTCNTVIEGKLALTMTLPMKTTAEDVKAKYGADLLKANECMTQIVRAAEGRVAAINKIFAVEEATA